MKYRSWILFQILKKDLLVYKNWLPFEDIIKKWIINQKNIYEIKKKTKIYMKFKDPLYMILRENSFS